MAYDPPITDEEFRKPVKKFQIFFASGVIVFIPIILSTWLFPDFWDEKRLWGIGSYITLFSVASNRYFDIKRNANKRLTRYEPLNLGINRNTILTWLAIEKSCSYCWLLGSMLLIISKWLEF